MIASILIIKSDTSHSALVSRVNQSPWSPEGRRRILTIFEGPDDCMAIFITRENMFPIFANGHGSDRSFMFNENLWKEIRSAFLSRSIYLCEFARGEFPQFTATIFATGDQVLGISSKRHAGNLSFRMIDRTDNACIIQRPDFQAKPICIFEEQKTTIVHLHVISIARNDILPVRRHAEHFTRDIELNENRSDRTGFFPFRERTYRIDQFAGIRPPRLDVVLFITGENLSVIFQDTHMGYRCCMCLKDEFTLVYQHRKKRSRYPHREFSDDFSHFIIIDLDRRIPWARQREEIGMRECHLSNRCTMMCDLFGEFSID